MNQINPSSSSINAELIFQELINVDDEDTFENLLKGFEDACETVKQIEALEAALKAEAIASYNANDGEVTLTLDSTVPSLVATPEKPVSTTIPDPIVEQFYAQRQQEVLALTIPAATNIDNSDVEADEADEAAEGEQTEETEEATDVAMSDGEAEVSDFEAAFEAMDIEG